MSQHRRLNPWSRHARRRRLPAYQVRQTTRPSSTAVVTAPERRPADADAVEHPSQPNGHPLEPAADVERQNGSGTEAFIPVEANEPTTTGADADSDSLDVAANDGDEDYEAFARSVEEAAKRSKAESVLARSAVEHAPRAGFRYVRTSDPRIRARRAQRPQPGGRGGGPRGPRGRSRNGRGMPEPDPRPLLKRPKTWFVMIAMIFAVSAIVVVLWTLNLARATYDAYNVAHVEPTPRTHFRVNPQGTPEAIPTEEVELNLPDWNRREPFNLLLLGIDDRDGEDEPARSDTMMIVRVDPTNRTVMMISIPRDLQVTIPGFRVDKINAAYPLGEYHEVPGGGPALAAQTIEANFDLPIHYFVSVDFTGFRKIVDTIGGVIIDVRAPVKDDQYPTETYGLTREYFPTGLQMMDGETALRFARTRHGDNDIARGERQQQMLMAIRQQAINLGLITRADDLIRDLGDTIRTDLNFNQLLALANVGRSIESDDIYRINLWELGLIYEHWPDENDDSFYLDADWSGIYDLINTYFRSASPPQTLPTPMVSQQLPPAASDDTGDAANSDAEDDELDLTIPIIVQNSSSADLIATSATRELYNAGFSYVTPENGYEIYETSVIYDYVGSPTTAQYLARQLGIDESLIVYGSGGSGIVVVLGEDYAGQ